MLEGSLDMLTWSQGKWKFSKETSSFNGSGPNRPQNITQVTLESLLSCQAAKAAEGQGMESSSVSAHTYWNAVATEATQMPPATEAFAPSQEPNASQETTQAEVIHLVQECLSLPEKRSFHAQDEGGCIALTDLQSGAKAGWLSRLM